MVTAQTRAIGFVFLYKKTNTICAGFFEGEVLASL